MGRISKGSTGLSQKLKDLQTQRDAGLITSEEYRKRAAAIVEDGQFGQERAALANHENIQSLTGAVGVMVEIHCKESWQQMVLKRWNAVRHKKTLLLVAFVILVVTIMAFLFVDEETAVDAMLDRGAGVHEQPARDLPPTEALVSTDLEEDTQPGTAQGEESAAYPSSWPPQDLAESLSPPQS